MTIHIDKLDIACIVGLLDFEREREQRVLLSLEIDYPYSTDHFLDYGKVVFMIEQNLKTEKYLLLEEALLGIKTVLFNAFPLIERLQIQIRKPDILPHCSVGLSEQWFNTPQ